MTAYTKAEQRAIKSAWDSMLHLCDVTNQSDKGDLQNALKLERGQGLSLVDARVIVLMQWRNGLDNPHTPVSDIYWKRPGALAAFILGVRHAVERVDHSYCGRYVAETRVACDAVCAIGVR